MITRITITGDIGSGKTTIANIVSERLGVKAIFTGGIHRQVAASRGIDTIALNRLAEHDPSIDEAVDSHLRSLPETASLVVESRMGWRFVPHTLKVFLYVEPEAAATRIFAALRGDEVYTHRQEALSAITSRRSSEIQRFTKYYGVNISDLRNYDLIVDTTYATPDSVAAAILSYNKNTERGPELFVSPLNLIPTQGIRQLSESKVLRILQDLRDDSTALLPPISILYVNHLFYLVDGHNRGAAAVKAGLPLVRAYLAAADGEEYLKGLSAEEYVRDAVTDTMLYDWQDAVGIKKS